MSGYDRGHRAPWTERIYAALLRWMPEDFESCREDALETFRDLDVEARSLGRVAAWRAFFRCAVRLMPAVAGRRIDRASVHGHEGPLRAWLFELRGAGRSLRRRPGFSTAVVLTLGLGIGAAAAVFGVVDGILLRPLPYPEAGRLVYFDEGSHPGPLFEWWQREVESLDRLAGIRDRVLDLTGVGAPVEVRAAEVSGDFFHLFGASAAHGRLLSGDDFVPGSRVAVLGAEVWKRRWGGDPEVIGTKVSLEGEPWTVVGVIDDAFVAPEGMLGKRVDVFLPLDTRVEVLNRWDHWILEVVGRLAPGVELAQARAEIDTIALQAADRAPEDRRTRDGAPLMTPLIGLHEATVHRVESALWMLLGAVGLMLLVACTNVAGLFLARGHARRREMGLRLALGARPRRLAARLVSESLILALGGAVLGMVLAQVLTILFRGWIPGYLPRVAEVSVDGRVLLVTVLVAAVAAIAFGAAPAIQAARAGADAVLRDAGSSTAGRRTRRARSMLVVAEVALALVLLCAAGVLGHGLLRLMHTELGFEVEGLIRLEARLGAGYTEQRREQFVRELLARTGALPEVQAASVGWTAPLDYFGGRRCCWRSRFVSDPRQEPLSATLHPVSPGYVRTLGAELVAGRDLVAGDEVGTPVPVVINQSFARRLFGDGPAVGQPLTKGDEAMQVVGVVDDVRHWGASSEAGDEVYVPYFRYGMSEQDLRLLVRSDPERQRDLADRLREIVWSLDPSLPVNDVALLERRVAHTLAEPRFYTALIAGFAFLGLALSAVGLCGTLLYMVSQRRRELGIRLAIGARASDLHRLVLGQGLRLVLLGLAIGLLGALAASRVLRSMVHGVSATDPATYAAVSIVLVLVAMLAAWLPARRAARTDPIETLRAD